MRPLRYSINVTLDGCCDHGATIPDLHPHAAENLAQALLFGRGTYEMTEAGSRPVARTGVRSARTRDWTEPFAPNRNGSRLTPQGSKDQ